MNLLVLEHLSGAHVDDLDLAHLRGHVECLVKGTPACAGILCTISGSDLLRGFWSVFWVRAGREHSGEIINANVGHLSVNVDEKELLITE